jgi:hypothetical protein
MSTSRAVHASFAEALSKGPPPTGNLAVPIFSHGSLVVELYTPVGKDPQKPHARDEVYFVARGNGVFFDGVNGTQLIRVHLCSCRRDRCIALKIFQKTLRYGSRFMALRAVSVVRKFM